MIQNYMFLKRSLRLCHFQNIDLYSSPTAGRFQLSVDYLVVNIIPGYMYIYAMLSCSVIRLALSYRIDFILSCPIQQICAAVSNHPTSVIHQLSPRASYQIRKIAGCVCVGNAGNVFSPPRVSDPDMHHGTLGSLTSGFLWSWWRGNSPGIPGACATLNFI